MIEMSPQVLGEMSARAITWADRAREGYVAPFQRPSAREGNGPVLARMAVNEAKYILHNIKGRKSSMVPDETREKLWHIVRSLGKRVSGSDLTDLFEKSEVWQ